MIVPAAEAVITKGKRYGRDWAVADIVAKVGSFTREDGAARRVTVSRKEADLKRMRRVSGRDLLSLRAIPGRIRSTEVVVPRTLRRQERGVNDVRYTRRP
mgnify:CR=1 FL=1